MKNNPKMGIVTQINFFYVEWKPADCHDMST